MRYLLILFACLLINPANADTNKGDHKSITIYYNYSSTEEINLAWGINNWNEIPASIELPTSKVSNNIIYTPMKWNGEHFSTTISIPAGVALNYAFQITKKDGSETNYWDTNEGEDYYLWVEKDSVIEINGRQTKVINEITYKVKNASAVELVWGINNWNKVESSERPPGTVIDNGLMYSPMVRDGELFKVLISAPKNSVVNLSFKISKNKHNETINEWDNNLEQGYEIQWNGTTKADFISNISRSSEYIISGKKYEWLMYLKLFYVLIASLFLYKPIINTYRKITKTEKSTSSKIKTQKINHDVRLPFICLIFFLSGIPALIYQLIWQRALFTIVGVNIESVTIVVTAFMLGLGLGSLLGGFISKKSQLPLLVLFAWIEICIGIFGFISLDLFEYVGSFTSGMPLGLTAWITLALVSIPTFLMGATLPILAAYLIQRSGNVGKSIGILYFVNTIGAGVSCFIVAYWLMKNLGMQTSVYIAVLINIVIGSGALLTYFRYYKETSKRTRTADKRTTIKSLKEGDSEEKRMNFSLALILVAVAGYIALSYEILWFRVYSFTTGSNAKAFALMLGAYLIGIAMGSLISRQFCKPVLMDNRSDIKALSNFIFLANGAGFFLIPLIAIIISRGVSYEWTLPLIGIEAALLGAAFPLICHFGIAPNQRAGLNLGYLYFANIVGAAAGSLITGFILMDFMSIASISVLLTLMGIGLAMVLCIPAKLIGRPLIIRADAAPNNPQNRMHLTTQTTHP